jgi:hypothetical protein
MSPSSRKKKEEEEEEKSSFPFFSILRFLLCKKETNTLSNIDLPCW